MDNELKELEAELQRLRPLAPSRTLTAALDRKLAPRRPNYWAWVALPLAAMLTVVVLWRERPATSAATTPVAIAAPAFSPVPATHPAAAAYKPVSADNVLYAQSDDGLVTLSDGTTARRYRSSYVDTITWKDPRSQASLRWSVPRTEERVIPVSFQ